MLLASFQRLPAEVAREVVSTGRCGLFSCVCVCEFITAWRGQCLYCVLCCSSARLFVNLCARSQGAAQPPVHLVVGNESGDVDSTASALSYAFLLSLV